MTKFVFITQSGGLMYNIYVELAISSLEIISADVEETQVYVKSSKNGNPIPMPSNLSISETNETLSIKEEFKDFIHKLGGFFNNKMNVVHIKVEIPLHYTVENISAVLSLGDLFLTDLTCETMRLKSHTGNIHIKNINCESLHASLSVGNIKASGSFHEVDLDLKTGNAKVTPSLKLKQINIKMGTGDINLFLPEIKEYSIYTSMKFGEYRLKGFDKTHFHEKNNDEKKIQVYSALGDFTIYRQE